MPVALYTKTGTKAASPAKLDKSVFGLNPENHELLKAAYTTYLSNGRENLAVTKTRGLVSGGGRKPWKQKGTGRARFGSSRNPIWRGGGIAFGPTGNENYTKRINVKAKRLAVRQALSLAATDGKISVIEDLQIKSGKTADLSKLLKKISASRLILLVTDQKTPELLRASANIASLDVVKSKYLNVFKVLNADTIIFTGAALEETTTWLKVPATKDTAVAKERSRDA